MWLQSQQNWRRMLKVWRTHVAAPEVGSWVVVVGGCFPRVPGSQRRWQVGGDTQGVFTLCPAGLCFYSGYPWVRQYRLLCICKQCLKGRGANKNSQLEAIKVCEGRLLNREAVAHCSGSAQPKMYFLFYFWKGARRVEQGSFSSVSNFFLF